MSEVVLEATANASAVADAVIDVLKGDLSLGLTHVYGDIPDRIQFGTPCAAVTTGPTTMGGGDQAGYPTLNYWTNHQFEIIVMVFYARVDNSRDEGRKEADIFAEKVRDSLHKNKQLNGLVYQGWVTRIDPGTIGRGGGRFRAHRLTVRYDSKTLI
jgi:hypothetical protein